jgi:hypothetical protein
LDPKEPSRFVSVTLLGYTFLLNMSVAQGLLDYQGSNTIAVSLWALDVGGAQLDSLQLEFTAQVESSLPDVNMIPITSWEERIIAY